MIKRNIAQMSTLLNRSIKEQLDEVLDQTDEYEKQLQICQQSQLRFCDQAFPADFTSISKSLDTPKLQEWRQYIWKRASDIFNNQFQVFCDQIEPADIKQGKLGDCYLLSALSVLAEKQQLVKRLFVTQEANDIGLYGIWLNVHGEWTTIVVDDFFLCLPSGQLAFSRSNGSELWVMLLEKAYAKVYGGYENIEGGNPSIALRDLTGAPYENMDECDEQDLWEYCVKNFKAGFLLTTHTKDSIRRESETELGILSGHAYAVLNLATVADNLGIMNNILQIRNPWGRVEWKGDWCDKSSKWTMSVRQTLNIQDQDDGIFWMNVKDFRKYFEGVGVCKIRENYYYNSLQCIVDSRNTSIIQLESTVSAHIYISLNQVDIRVYEQSNPDYKYPFCRMVIVKLINNKNIQYIQGVYKQDRNIDLEFTCEFNSKYLILIEIQYLPNTVEKHITVSTYASQKLQLKRTQLLDHSFLLRHAYKSYSELNLKQCKETNYKQEYQQDISKVTGTKDGLLIFHYINRTNNCYLKENISINKLNGYCYLHPLDISMCVNNNINFILQPQKELVLLITQVQSESGTCEYSYQTSSALLSQSETLNDVYILPPLNLNDQYLSGRDILNHATITVAPRKNLIFQTTEPIKIYDFELLVLNTSNDIFQDYWDVVVYYSLGLQILINLILFLRKPMYLQCVIVSMFYFQLWVQAKKHMLRILVHAQLFGIMSELAHIFLLSSDIPFAIPLQTMSVFMQTLGCFNIILQLVQYIILVKCLINFNQAPSEIIQPFRIRISTLLGYIKI